MNNIFDSIKLDYYILRTFSPGALLSSVGIATLAGIISSSPGLIIGIVLMVSAFFMGGLFAVVEKNNINKLYGILPVRKQQIVIGRYLLTLFVGVLNAAMATILTYFVSFILDIKLSYLTLIGWLFGSFFLFCLLVSMQFPIYFRYEFSKVSSISNMPAIILFIIGSALIKKRPELFQQTINFFIDNQYMIWLIGIVGALLLLGVSMFLSYALSKKRDF
jgi:hypothetical protein